VKSHVMDTTVPPPPGSSTCCHCVCHVSLYTVLTYALVVLSVMVLGPYGRPSAHCEAVVTANRSRDGAPATGRVRTVVRENCAEHCIR
jgi:hypothetical protein